MIRNRIPEKDDEQLFNIIITRLMPFAKQARPDVRFKRQEVRRRWRACKVYVAQGAGHNLDGFISCKLEGTVLVIDMLGVSRQAEGRGLGSALIATAESYGRRNGAKQARLAVDEPNPHAIRFYMAKGFETETYLPEYRMYIMTKRL